VARSRAIRLDGFFRHQQPWSSRLHGFFQRLDVGVGVMVLQDVALGREHGIKKTSGYDGGLSTFNCRTMGPVAAEAGR
jgi:hypothetical protein